MCCDRIKVLYSFLIRLRYLLDIFFIPRNILLHDCSYALSVFLFNETYFRSQCVHKASMDSESSIKYVILFAKQ